MIGGLLKIILFLWIWLLLLNLPRFYSYSFSNKKNLNFFEKKKKLFDSPIRFDKHKKCRLGIVPRYGSEIKWVEIPSQFIFHTMNAYEKEVDGKVKIIMQGCHWSYLTLTPGPHDKQPFPYVFYLYFSSTI